MNKVEAIRILRDMAGDLDQSMAKPIEYTTRDQKQAVMLALDSLIGNPKKVKCRKDLTGKRFGMLTVIGRAEDVMDPSGRLYPFWKCRCDCGNVKDIRGVCLTHGNTKSCGCRRKTVLPGNRYGRLVVIRRLTEEEDRRVKPGASYYLCKCDCGQYAVVFGGSLTRGRTKSCGCLQSEWAKALGKSRKKGGCSENTSDNCHKCLSGDRWQSNKGL